MPYINVRIASGATKEQKEQVIREITDVMAKVLGKDPKTTYVVIDEVNTDNWGVGGESLTTRRQKK